MTRRFFNPITRRGTRATRESTHVAVDSTTRRRLSPAAISAAMSVMALVASSAVASALEPVAPEAPSEPISVEFVTSIVGAPEGTPLLGAALEEKTNSVAAVLRCPVCQGSTVGDSPSQSARNMKAEVRDLLAAGFTADQVMAYFEFSYGEFVRLAPKAEGFNLFVWLAPILLLLGGGAVTALAIRRFSAGAPQAAAVVGASEDGSDDMDHDTDAAVDPELDPYLDRVRALAYGTQATSAGKKDG